MGKDRLSGKLAVILHADIAGSTALVQLDEKLAHERIQDAFGRFSETIENYQGHVQELRGDALLAEFGRASDAVTAALAFQAEQTNFIAQLDDDLKPIVRVGIAMGEVIIADNTITGAGVVLAQRVEQLAKPGGLCITGAIHEALPQRMPFEQENLGDQVLKGFEEPIRVYTVGLKDGAELPEPTKAYEKGKSPLIRSVIIAIAIALLFGGGLVIWLQPWVPEYEPASVEKMAIPLPDKPSIAVLPFTNMSSDAEQEYFSDGITEDIITDLAKISGLFVVARNSTFTYRGQAIKIRQVAEELGVRYVLGGSVRRAGDKIRITAQLIDALKGNHIWAERYDRELKDVFSVQSEVARQVAKVLAVTLKANDNERLFQKYTTNIDAYDVFLQARRVVDVPTKDNILRGEKLFSRVIELDPNFAGGYAGLAFNYSVQVRFQYSTSPSTHLARTFELAEKAIEVDSNFAWGYIALGGAHLANGDAAAAVDAMRQVLILEPNGYEANLFMGFYLQFAGEAALAVEHLLLARRLSPVVSVRDLAFMTNAQFMNGNYAEVVRIQMEWDRKFPGRWSTARSVVMAATYTLLERPEEAAAIVKELLDTHPNFNLSQWKFGKLWKSEDNRARLYDAAKQAGIPEFPND